MPFRIDDPRPLWPLRCSIRAGLSLSTRVGGTVGGKSQGSDRSLPFPKVDSDESADSGVNDTVASQQVAA